MVDCLLERVKEAEKHMEIINGVEVIQDKTTPIHNNAVMEIASALMEHISSRGIKCQVFTQNVALFINEMCGNNDLFLPDVMAVCDEDICEDGIHIAPLFIAEVTSESSKINDYGYKREVYRSIGVTEYWIVDIQRHLIEKHLLSKGYISDCYFHPEAMKVTTLNMVTDVSGYMDEHQQMKD